MLMVFQQSGAHSSALLDAVSGAHSSALKWCTIVRPSHSMTYYASTPRSCGGRLATGPPKCSA